MTLRHRERPETTSKHIEHENLTEMPYMILREMRGIYLGYFRRYSTAVFERALRGICTGGLPAVVPRAGSRGALHRRVETNPPDAE
jgi:hypothetical protein